MAFDHRIERLERDQARAAATVQDARWYQFTVSPSCPPDKRLHIRAGIATPSALYGANIEDDFIPYTVCDFENEAETQLALQFTNAGYYLPVILCYYWEWVCYRTLGGYDEPVFDNVTGTEVETAAEAEAQIDAWLNGSMQWYQYRLPLWAVVLRNDGQAGVNYAILPVDAVNRGRSYLYRDARARHSLFP